MKKSIYLFCLFALGLLLLPKLVLAEDYPTEGVHYFLTYPNGEEVITTDYEEAVNPKEKLIYEGKTNADGEVVLENLITEGQLRIVQEIPDGYSSEKREITFDFSQTNQNVGFVDFKTSQSSDYSISNPKTGQSLLFVIILGMVLLVAWKTFKKETPKGTLFLLSILLLGTFAFQVYASDNALVITVADPEGKRLSDVMVKVYAYPSRIQTAPAVKFSANGGSFFDGTKEMYVKIPQSCVEDSCSFHQFLENLSTEEREYVSENIMGAYRDGYHPQKNHEGLDLPNQFINGAEVSIKWEEDENAKLITIDGNGGYYDYHGKKLFSMTGYASSIDTVVYGFQKENAYSVGADEASTCSNYNTSGILNHTESWSEDVDTVYVCWNEKPDGIYVNDVLFLGNIETCYHQSNLSYPLKFQLRHFEFNFVNLEDTSVQFSSLKKKTISLTDDTLSNVTLSVTPSDNNLLNETKIEVGKLEIIQDGQTIVSLTTPEFEIAEGLYTINHDEKLTILADYLNRLVLSCLK